MRARFLLVVASLLAQPAGLLAQAGSSGERPPRRPRLADGVDTNSAHAYYSLGMDKLDRRPDEAADAFYWAARLDPASAYALYARRIALLLDDPVRLRGYLENDRRTVLSPEIRRIDSLEVRAIHINPFLHEDLDGVLITHYVESELGRLTNAAEGQGDPAEIHFMVITYLRNEHPALRALFAYAEGRYAEALQTWAELERANPRNAEVRALRARVFVLVGAYDSARVELTAALGMSRQEDSEHVYFVYESKEEWEASLGWIYERLRNPAEARACYERALVENLGYFPAHARLGALAFNTGDTARALTELRAAVALKDDDYPSQTALGLALAKSQQYDSAIVHLVHAAALEPWAAQAELVLAITLDESGDTGGALLAYERFLAKTVANDRNAAAVRARVTAIRQASRP